MDRWFHEQLSLLQNPSYRRSGSRGGHLSGRRVPSLINQSVCPLLAKLQLGASATVAPPE